MEEEEEEEEISVGLENNGRQFRLFLKEEGRWGKMARKRRGLRNFRAYVCAHVNPAHAVLLRSCTQSENPILNLSTGPAGKTKGEKVLLHNLRCGRAKGPPPLF